jgi:hypothetical protein
MILGMDNRGAQNANRPLQKERISARISDDGRCFSGPSRPEFQGFCGADEIGG